MNNKNKEKRSVIGRFLIFILAIILLFTIIIFHHYDFHQIELLKKGHGFLEIREIDGRLIAQNRYKKEIVIEEINGDFATIKTPGFPIKTFSFPPYNDLLIFHYLSPVILKVKKRGLLTEEISLYPPNWIPASICEQSGKSVFIAFRSAPYKGKEKSFPYYLPVVNRFPFVILEGENVLGGKTNFRTTGGMWEYENRHEESAGIWNSECLSDGNILITSPTGQNLIKYSMTGNEIIWKSRTGKRPVALAVSDNSGVAWVAHGQEPAIWVYNLSTGAKLGEIKTGRGITGMKIYKEKIVAVNPHKRAVLKIDPLTREIKKLYFERGIPTDLIIRDDKILVANGESRGFWEVSFDLEKSVRQPFKKGK